LTAIDQLDVSAYTVPTSSPEANGTLQWDQTTIVVVEARAGGVTGLGYSYADLSTAAFIGANLGKRVVGRDAMSPQAAWIEMVREIRNVGRAGVASMAISAVDVALWDLKARLMNAPLVVLLGAVRDRIAAYGSGGFTTYTDEQLQDQLSCWVREGMRAVKMKIGAQPERDVARAAAARKAIGDSTELFVDANGAYTRKQALALAEAFAPLRVTWFEEPVSSDDLEGLRLIRNRAPAGMDIAAGEYGYDAYYFRRMLQAGAVDILQADATRCGGVTGFMKASEVCDSFGLPFSAHTAPSLHGHLCCAAFRARNIEYFHDHARIEQTFFEGALKPDRGDMKPDLTRPGLGLEFKRADARKYQVYAGRN
jgi:L-alanine-DL-glutamate epimerase-like enolase superfamily enzyme